MTREEIIALAREAGFVIGGEMCPDKIFNPHTADEFSIHAELERFAALVAAREREECAKLAENEWSNVAERMYGQEMAAAIRARGHQDPANCQNPGRCAHPFCSCGGSDVANA